MVDQGRLFRDLHVPGKPFVLANAWDIGSARMLAALGAKAIATSSAAHAFTLGRPDMGNLTRDESLAHAQDLMGATPLPVTGDFENGFGHDPETVAETVRLSAETGLAGICVEDTVLPDDAAYDFDLAVERIKAGAAAARAASRDFFFVARADGVMNGAYDMTEALRRVQAFDAAGADGIYVPMPPDMAGLKAICQATRKPVNALAAGRFRTETMDSFAAAGAARVSLGSALARATHKTILDAARAIFDDGDFSMTGGVGSDVIDTLLERGARTR